MSGGLTLRRVTHWRCDHCQMTKVTVNAPPNARVWHPCPGMGGMTAPLIEEGVKAKVEVIEREDYVGRERVQYDDRGRPVMAIKTTRDEGEDTVVFAPLATLG